MPDELDVLFPDLAPILKDWGRAGHTSIPTDEHGGVTDEAVAAYIQGRMGGVGPAPVNGTKAGAPFTAGSTGAPPPDSHVEGGAPANAQRIESQHNNPPSPQAQVAPQGLEGDEEEQDGEEEVDGTEADTEADLVQPSVPSDDTDDEALPPELAARYAEFHKVVTEDPRLARFIADYLTTGTLPVEQTYTPPVAAPSAQPLSQPPADVPTFTIPEEYADDPAVQALYSAIQAQNEQIRQLTQTQFLTQQQLAAREEVSNEALVTRAKEAFKDRYDLDDAAISKLERTAANMNILPSFLRGIHPIYGTPFKPDPIAAVTEALDVAYHATPEFRAHEIERAAATRKQDAARRKKLGGIMGSGGSVPRSTPAPIDAQGRRTAMTQEIAEMMAGTWGGNGQ